MTQNSPAPRVVRRSVSIALASGLVLSAAACTPTGDFVLGSRDAATDGPAPIVAASASERDVEAPEVFDVTDEGLWDGRPSLGGVWVAHPEATDPERVMIRNAETGRFVIGALFRRERENPGPPLQVSSEAAAALDLLAGNPTSLQVTALRREAPAAAETAPADAATEATADPTETEAVPVETAAAPAGTGAPLPESAPDTAVAAPAAGGFLGALNRVFGTGRAATRASEAAPEAAAAPAPAPAQPRNMSADDVTSGIRTASFSTTEIEAVRPVSAVASAADAAIAEAEASVPRAATALQPPSEAVRVPAPARAPQTSLDTPLGRAFIQVGLFSVRENAEAAGQTLRRAGLVPTIREENGNGRRTWRVVVGPAPTAEDRAAVLNTVRGAGFGDAYFVSR